MAPEPQQFEEACDSMAERLEKAGVTEAMLQATLPQVREELVRRRYPELFSAEEKLTRRTKACRTRKKTRK